jgi:hypothetical protein
MTDCTGERRDTHEDGTRARGGSGADASTGPGAERGVDPDAEVRSSDWRTTGELCLAVVEGVAAVTGREPTALPPLYPALDVDALETLLRGARGTEVRVTFCYAGCAVAVSSDGDLAVEATD